MPNANANPDLGGRLQCVTTYVHGGNVLGANLAVSVPPPHGGIRLFFRGDVEGFFER